MGTESLELNPQTAFDKSTSNWPYFIGSRKVAKTPEKRPQHWGISTREALISAYLPLFQWIPQKLANEDLDAGLRQLRIFCAGIKKNLDSVLEVQGASGREALSSESSSESMAILFKPGIIEEDIEYDIVLHLPPKSETTMKVKLKFEGRAKPKIVEPEEIDGIWQ